MLLGLAVPEVRLPAGRPPAGERLAAGLATGSAPAGAAAAGLDAGTSPTPFDAGTDGPKVRTRFSSERPGPEGRAGRAVTGLGATPSRPLFSGRADDEADGPPPLRGRLGAPVFPAETGTSLAPLGAGVDGPKVRTRFSSERPGPEGRDGRAPVGLGAPPSRPLFSGRADDGADGPPPLRGRLGAPVFPAEAVISLAPFGAGVDGPKVRTRFSSGRPGPEGRAGRALAGLGTAASRVRFSAGRLGPGLPEGLPRFCDGPVAPEGFDGLAPKWEGPGFPERLFVGMGSSSRAHIPCVVNHSVPVRHPPDKRNSPN